MNPRWSRMLRKSDVNFAIAVNRFSGRQPDAREVAARAPSSSQSPPPLREYRASTLLRQVQGEGGARHSPPTAVVAINLAGTPGRRGSKEHRKACVGKTL